MNTRTLFFLFLILSIGCVFRFYRITEHGLYDHDEMVYYRQTITAGNSILNYFRSSAQKDRTNFLQAALPIANAFAAKPGHILLGLWGFCLWGSQQYGFLITTIVWSLLTIAVVFLIGYKFYGQKAGLMSALLLSICAIHIRFSRTYMAHIDEVFFVTLATLFYLLSKTKNRHQLPCLLAAGLCLGFAFTIHPQAILYAPLFLIYEIIGYFTDKNRSFSAKISRTVFLFSTYLIPILVFGMVSIFGNIASGAPAISTGLNKSYFGQIIWNINETRIFGEESNPNLDKWFLLKYFSLSQGFIFALLSILSCLALVKNIFSRQRLADFIILSQSGALFFYWQFFSGREQLLRFIVATMPFFCLAIGVFLEENFKLAQANKTVKILLVGALILESGWASARTIFTDNSPYLLLQQFLITKKAKRVLSTSGSITNARDVLMPNLKDITIIYIKNPALLKETILQSKIEYLVLFPGDWFDSEAYHFKAKPELVITNTDYPGFYQYLAVKGRLGLMSYWGNPLAKSITVYKAEDILTQILQ